MGKCQSFPASCFGGLFGYGRFHLLQLLHFFVQPARLGGLSKRGNNEKNKTANTGSPVIDNDSGYLDTDAVCT